MSTVVVDIDAHVATLTFGAPPANALTGAMVDGLAGGLHEVQSADARVLIIRSAVPGFFMAGADLKLLHTTDRSGFAAYLKMVRAEIERIPSLGCVSIAAIDGHALGGGFELAAACTFRVAGPAAQLAVPEIKLGVLPGAGGTQRLFDLTTRGAALDLLLTGRSVGAEEALRLGLVDRLDPEGADAGARALAEAIAVYPRSALQAILRCADAAREETLQEGLEVEFREVVELFGGADAKEGIAAFIEKRPPRFP